MADAPAPDSSSSVGPAALPLELMDRATEGEGEDTGDRGNKSLPPTADQLPQGEHNDSLSRQADWSSLSVSEHVAREALIRYTASKCCYMIAPAKHMVIQNLTPLNTFRYRLQTFTETREKFLISEIYDGGFVDSSDIASAPAPWAMVVDTPPLFTDCEMHIPVPHTYSVQDCLNCQGRGTNRCHSCNGSGKIRCTACSGTGWQDTSNQCCLFCSGSGKRGCSNCHVYGWRKCIRCYGRGLLLYHSELTITWKNNIAEYVVDKNSGFPVCYLQEVTGKEIFSDENQVVYPIVDFPESTIDWGSQSCIAQHQMQLASNSHILRQDLQLGDKQGVVWHLKTNKFIYHMNFCGRKSHFVRRFEDVKQTIELIPLTKVEYEWRGKVYSFYVFGNENKVYAENYPGKCCCSLM